MFTVAKKKKVKTNIKAVQPPLKKERSKGRSVSVTKSKDNIRLATKPDAPIEDDLKKHKAFISLNEQIDANATAKHCFQSVCEPQPRRRRTPQRKRNKTNSSHSQLLKLEPRKRQVHSAMDNKRKSKDKLKPKKAKQLPAQQTSVMRRPKLQISIDDLEQMELMNRDHLMSVTSSGEIVFSSQRDSKLGEIHKTPIDEQVNSSKQEFEVDPNALLRIHLKKEYKKKVAAVIKIQKIWRGYQTRKLLDKFIRDAIKDYKPEQSSEQHFEDFAPLKRSPPKKDDHSMSFNTNKISSDYPDLADCSEIKMSEPIPPINQIIMQPEQSVESETFGVKDTLEPKPAQVAKEVEPFIEESKDNNAKSDEPEEIGYGSEDQEDEESQNEEDEEEAHLYRHQRPIYSYEDIHQYLQNSQKQNLINKQDDDDDDEEMDFYDQRYEQYQVIVQTNQEYLDSRKNSTHTKKNKTIESRKQSKDKDQFFEVRKFSKESREEIQILEARKTSKQIQHKVLEPTENIQKSPVLFVQESNQKENQGAVSNKSQPFENHDSESTKSDYKEEVARLKKEQILKWNRMIDFIKGNIRKTGGDVEMQTLLNQIVMQSEENKKRLEQNLPKDSQTLETRLTTHQQQLPSKPKFNFQDIEKPQQQQINPEPANQKSMFRKKHLQLDIDNIGTYKKQPVQQIVQAIKSRSDDSHLSNEMKINWNLELQQQPRVAQSPSSNHKAQIKNLLEQKILNLSSSNLNNIISIREEMLKQRKISEQEKLRKLLAEKKIELVEFEERVASLLDYIENQRADIERAKKDIEKGLRVAAQVAVKTQRDARWLGKSTGLSKSAEQLRKMPQFSVPFQPLDRMVFVDEMPRRVRQRNVNFFGEDSAESSEQGQFISEEQIKKFKEPKYNNLEFNDMNKNIMIEEFLKSQKSQNYKNSLKKQKQEKEIEENQTKVTRPKGQKSTQLRPQIKEPPVQRMQSHVLRGQANTILESLVQKLMLECAVDIYRRPCVFQTAASKLGLTVNRPQPISRDEILTFVSLIQRRLPEQSLLLQRLNQQISPPPLQLLKCMRVDFYEDDDMSQEELGKYEFVIPEASCNEAIKEMDKRTPIIQVKERRIQFRLEDLDPEAMEFVEKRERLWQRRLQDLRDRRAEVLNIEMHCVFDCWNEQIITLKSQMPGFSGIGLNQPTLALQDHNKPVNLGQVDDYIKKSKDKLLQIIMDDSDLNQKISVMSYEQMCYNEGSWICYTDESLGFVLELDYIIGEELMAEVARFLHRQMVRQSLVNPR